jgi:hypothetical protein
MIVAQRTKPAPLTHRQWRMGKRKCTGAPVEADAVQGHTQTNLHDTIIQQNAKGPVSARENGK